MGWSSDLAGRLYRSSPVALQHAAATAFGVRERVLRYGGRHREYARDLSESQWWPPDRLQQHQDERLRQMVEFCVAQVPHYRDLFRDLGLAAGSIRTATDLAQLPVLEKETVRARPERFVPERGRGRERLLPATTGGTTGTPLRFFVTMLSGAGAAPSYEDLARPVHVARDVHAVRAGARRGFEVACERSGARWQLREYPPGLVGIAVDVVVHHAAQRARDVHAASERRAA